MNIASKSQAENGNDNETLMTPLRVKQSIKANAITPGSALDYSVLENKPKINNVELSGNKSSNELGINENVQADWNTIDSADGSFIKNKPTIPTKTSDLNNDSGFVKNTDYAQPSTGGVVLADNTYGFRQTSGKPFADIKSYSNYEDASSNIFIAKGTLENVITGKGLIDNTVNNLTNYTKTSDLATVATSGNYNDLTNKPTIPTVNNATLTIQKNGTNVQTFTANASSDVTANITVPTKTSELTNDSNFATESYVDNLIEPLDERVNGEATEELTNASSYSVDNTLDMPFKDVKQLLGNTTQSGTPTPSSPVEVQNITGRQEVKCVGKNLCNIENAQIGKTWSNNSNTQRATVLYIPIKRNQQYTLTSSWTSSSITQIRGVLNNGPSDMTNNLVVTGTFTVPSNQWSYISIEILANTTFTSSMLNGVQIMFCEGSATDYEPYKEETNEINLGKNLFDSSNWKQGDLTTGSGTNRVTSTQILWLEAGTYTFSCNITSPFRYAIQGQTTGKIPLSSYPTLTHNSGWKSASSPTYTFTLTSGCWIDVCMSKENNADLTVNEIKDFKYQIEKGSEATTYSPYFTPIELCKIGTYQDKIFKTTGKNIFDDEIELGNISPSDGSLSASTTRTRSKNFIKVKPNTTYRFTRQKGENRWVIGYKADKTGITDGNHSGQASALGSGGSATLTFTFTTSATTEYIKWYDTSSTYLTEQVMISEGSTQIEYEPYGNGEWYVKKAIGKAILNGSESWDTIGNNRYWVAFPDKRGLTSQVPCLLMSNYFKSTTNAGDTVNVGQLTEGYYTIANYNVFFNYNGSNTDLAGFKTWLSTHNTIVYYVLSTPTYEKLNDSLQEQLNTLQNTYLFKGQTNIIVDGNLPAIIDFIVYKDNVEGKYESLKSMFQKIINMIESG